MQISSTQTQGTLMLSADRNSLPDQQPSEAQLKLMKEYASNIMKRFLIIIVFQLYQIKILPLIISFIFLMVYDLLEVYEKIKQFREQHLRMHLYSLAENLLSITFIMMLLVNIKYHYVQYHQIGIILVCQFVYRLFYHLIHRKSEFFLTGPSLCLMVVKLLTIAGFFTLALKLDKITQITWGEVFWWFWIIFGLGLALVLICILMLINHYVTIAFGDHPQYTSKEIKQIIFMLNYSIYLVLLNYFWVKGCEESLSKLDYKNIYISLIFTSAHVLTFSPLCYCWEDIVIELFVKIIFDDETTNKKNLFTKIGINLAPKYLKKISDGYYKVQIKKKQSTINQKKFVKNEINQESPSEAKFSQKSVQLSENQKCVICFDNPGDGVFMPCGHGGICIQCAQLSQKNSNMCLLCRQEIQQIFKIDINGLNNSYVTVIQQIEKNSQSA